MVSTKHFLFLCATAMHLPFQTLLPAAGGTQRGFGRQVGWEWYPEMLWEMSELGGTQRWMRWGWDEEEELVAAGTGWDARPSHGQALLPSALEEAGARCPLPTPSPSCQRGFPALLKAL